MKKSWFIGFMGLWLVILGLLGIPSSAQKILIIISGVIITLVSFWKGTNETVTESTERLKNDEKLS